MAGGRGGGRPLAREVIDGLPLARNQSCGRMRGQKFSSWFVTHDVPKVPLGVF